MSQISFGFRQSRFRRQNLGLILTLLNLEKDLSFPYHSAFGKENFFKHALGPRADLNSLVGRSLADKLAEDGYGFLSDFGHDYRWRRGWHCPHYWRRFFCRTLCISGLRQPATLLKENKHGEF